MEQNLSPRILWFDQHFFFGGESGGKGERENIAWESRIEKASAPLNTIPNVNSIRDFVLLGSYEQYAYIQYVCQG